MAAWGATNKYAGLLSAGLNRTHLCPYRVRMGKGGLHSQFSLAVIGETFFLPAE